MENAHLRMGILEYDRHTEKIATRIRVRVSHYVGEEEDAHLISIFGNDSDVGAITAAVYEQARFSSPFPTGNSREVTLGEGATCYRGSLSIPGRKHVCAPHDRAFRRIARPEVPCHGHLLFDRSLKKAGRTIVHRLGLPALPDWAEVMMRVLDREQPHHATRRHRMLPGRGLGEHRGTARMVGSRSRQRRTSVSGEERVNSLAGWIIVGCAHDDRRRDREGRLVRRLTWKLNASKRFQSNLENRPVFRADHMRSLEESSGRYRQVTVSETFPWPRRCRREALVAGLSSAGCNG